MYIATVENLMKLYLFYGVCCGFYLLKQAIIADCKKQDARRMAELTRLIGGHND